VISQEAGAEIGGIDAGVGAQAELHEACLEGATRNVSDHGTIWNSIE
jgi:hypothetical protein